MAIEASPAADLIVALEAQLTEQRERTAELEERLRRLEQRLAGPVAVEPARPAPAEAAAAPPVPVRSIDSWKWSEAAEWGYWLRCCEGFHVRDASGLLGVVESVRFGSDLEVPETLIVASGRRGRRRHIELAVSELAALDPDARQITLAVPAREWLLPRAPRRRLPWPRSLERGTPLL